MTTLTSRDRKFTVSTFMSTYLLVKNLFYLSTEVIKTS
jgi:hypothetical protein